MDWEQLTWNENRLCIFHSGCHARDTNGTIRVLWDAAYLFSELKTYGFTERPSHLCKVMLSRLSNLPGCVVGLGDTRPATCGTHHTSAKAALAYVITQSTVKQCNSSNIKAACLFLFASVWCHRAGRDEKSNSAENTT